MMFYWTKTFWKLIHLRSIFCFITFDNLGTYKRKLVYNVAITTFYLLKTMSWEKCKRKNSTGAFINDISPEIQILIHSGNSSNLSFTSIFIPRTLLCISL